MFALGLFAASFSSLLVNALTGATLLADGLGKDYRLTGPVVKHLATVIMLIGLAGSLLMTGTPVRSIILLQRITLLTVPLLGLALLWAFNHTVRGPSPMKLALNLVAGAGFLLLLALFWNLVRTLV
jgi:Mn2+/Fe2+ NRAMP family transporter